MNALIRTKSIYGALALGGALLINSAPALAQGYGYDNGYGQPPQQYGQPAQNAPQQQYAPPAQSIDTLVSRIALYPDPLLAQIFAAAAYPDQIAAASQGAGGPFDPSVESLLQYPSVLQMMASDPGWTQALGQAVMQNEGAVMDTIQNLRRQAQQFGYLQSGPQMQVVDDGGYIDILPAGGYMYVPMYDPYIVFARPRPGFFVGGAIRFGGGFRWAGGYGYNRFDWGRHQVFVNQRVWTPPARSFAAPRNGFVQRGFENNRQNFNGGRKWNRGYAAPAPMQRGFTPQQQDRGYGQQFGQRNFTAPQQQPQQHEFNRPQGTIRPQQNFSAPRQLEQQRNFAPQQQRNFAPQQQRNFAPQQRNERGHSGEGRGHGR
jgi:Protein of unknown function (DUF3300)